VKKQLSIKIRNELSELNRVNDLVQKFADDNGVSPEVLYKIQLAIEEIVTNVISYAFEDNQEHEIAIKLSLEGNLVRVIICDDGIAFDPSTVEDPELSDDLDNRKIGGLGIFLVKNLMKQVGYSRTGNRNILEMEIEKDATD
jgi:anti-sigma regulatory factor (Ser/Thr protein kinase)